MIAILLKAGRAKILNPSAVLVALTACLDWYVARNVSLAALYILPMMLGAVVMRPVETALVAAMEFKSQVGPSFSNNFNNRAEEAIGSATDIWVAYREGRFGKSPAPFLGYFFLLEDCTKVRTPVRNKQPYFSVDPAFRKASYSKRYEILCRRLVLERVYSSACLVKATNARETKITEPARDLSFKRFVAALQGHIVTFLGSRG